LQQHPGVQGHEISTFLTMCFRAASSGIAKLFAASASLAIVVSPYIWDREMGSTVPSPGGVKQYIVRFFPRAKPRA